MSEHGGYRRPAKPAPVSGVGKHSRRTDGKPGETMAQAAKYLSGGDYGDGQEVNGLASSAPLARGVQPSDADTPQVTPPTPIDAPTEYPDEPITAGMAIGDGPGPVQRAERDPYPEDDVVALTVRAAYFKNPTPALKRMVDRLDREGR